MSRREMSMTRAARAALAAALLLAALGAAPALAAAPAVGAAPAALSEAIDPSAVYADGSAFYLNPQEPSSADPVTLKLRTGKDDFSDVLLRVEDAALPMAKLASEGAFDYWYAELGPRASARTYYFELARRKATYYYGRRGLDNKVPDDASRFRIAPGFKVPDWMKGAVLYQIYVDRFANGDSSNDVLTNEYMYDNWPSVRVGDWNALPDATTPYAAGGNRTREFFGGDLEGIIQKLGYLKELGIEGIYLNPIFVSPSNHKYDSQDYEHVDPHFGVIVKDGGALIDPAKDPNYRKAGASDASTVNRDATKYIIRTTDPANLAASDAKLKELVDKAHALGIKVILDGVFNHSGSFNRWFDREGVYPASQGPGAYESKDSPFRSYYSFSKDAWPNNESYEAWSGFKTLPKLNFEGSPELERAILGIGARWVAPRIAAAPAAAGGAGADGWRLDVATDLGHSPKYNHSFWAKFRASVKAANPEAVILAEVYGDASSWLQGDQWDTVMNYDAFFEPVGWFLTGLEKHSYYYREGLHNSSRTFAADLADKMAKLPWNSLEIAMNELDNHDHSRFLTRTSGFVDDKRSTADVSPQDKAGEGVNKGVLKEAVILQMTLPGAPTLYYGDEAGLAGFTDPDDRRTYPWGREDRELLGFYRDAIAARKEYSALRTGSFATLSASAYGLYALGRWDASSRAVAAVNNYKEAREVEIPVGVLGLADGDNLELALVADRESHSRPGTVVAVSGGALKVVVPAFGGVILASRSSAREPGPTVADADRPYAKRLSPAPNSRNAPPKAVTVEFSEPMGQRLTADVLAVRSGAAPGGPRVEGRLVWNGNSLSFVPAAPLAGGSYTVELSAEVSALRGGLRLARGTSWSFAVK
jgi:alpha-glucosidase